MKTHHNRRPIRSWLISLYYTMFCTFIYAQTDYTIRGEVTDETGQPVAYANIALRDVTDSTLIGGTISDEQGLFNFMHRVPGTYLLTASFIGYESGDTTLRQLPGEVSNVVSIILRREQFVLDEVVIRRNRQKAKQQVDRTIYYVNSKMRSSSQTGIDLMGQVPGVRVDLLNTISLNGSTQIIILVNGIKRDAEYLGQLDADRIDRIEIGSGGGLQYGAEVTGLMNVILKEEEHVGISGHVYANVPTQAAEVFSFPSASLIYSRKKTTWYTSYDGGFSYFNIEGNTRKVASPVDCFREISRTDKLMQENWSHKLHFGMDRFNNDRNQLSLYGFVSGFSNEQDGRMVIEENTDVSAAESYHLEKDDSDMNRSAYGSAYFRHQFNPASILTMEGSYYLLRSQASLDLTESESGFRQGSRAEPGQDEIDLRIFFSSRFNERVSVESGIQQQLHFMRDHMLPSFTYCELVSAGYLQGAFKGERFQVNGGVRAELSHVIYSDVLDERRLFLLPQLDLKYNLNGKNNLKITYGKRVKRPNIQQLNPNPFISDPYTLQYGNPGLVPEVVHKFSATYSVSFRENFLSAGVFYKQEKGVLEDLVTLMDPVLFRRENQNLGNLHFAGMEGLGSINLHEKFSINPHIEFYHVQTRGSALARSRDIADRNALEFRGKMSAIWAIKEDLSLSASLQCQSTTTGIQHVYREGALYFISVEKVFFGQLKVGLTSAIPFMRSFTYQGYDISAADFTASSEDNIKMSLIPIWFKLKYSFASGNKVRRLERDKVYEEKRVEKGF